MIDRTIGTVTGNNTPKNACPCVLRRPCQCRACMIAVLVVNAPLGDPVGTIFFRYATLAFEAVG